MSLLQIAEEDFQRFVSKVRALVSHLDPEPKGQVLQVLHEDVHNELLKVTGEVHRPGAEPTITTGAVGLEAMKAAAAVPLPKPEAK